MAEHPCGRAITRSLLVCVGLDIHQLREGMGGSRKSSDDQQDSNDTQSPATYRNRPDDEARESDAQLDRPGDRLHAGGT